MDAPDTEAPSQVVRNGFERLAKSVWVDAQHPGHDGQARASWGHGPEARLRQTPSASAPPGTDGLLGGGLGRQRVPGWDPASVGAAHLGLDLQTVNALERGGDASQGALGAGEDETGLKTSLLGLFEDPVSLRRYACVVAPGLSTPAGDGDWIGISQYIGRRSDQALRIERYGKGSGSGGKSRGGVENRQRATGPFGYAVTAPGGEGGQDLLGAAGQANC